ncbi:MAG: FimB/Mfa2 family fimbrial subunit [Prevotella sp.]|nr:FimB/Mfa2 family fimbrial subunit [Prevotella sp.]
MLREGAKRLSFLGMLCLALGFSSCDSIFDDEQDCLHGVALRFVYDYHMEPGANAFAANVDCINVFVFDSNGNYVTQFKETSDALRNDSYRMNIPLDNGKYLLMVYGGTACEHSRFNLTPDWTSTPSAKKDDILVTLPRNAQAESDVRLHNIEDRTGGLFYGTLEVELTDKDYNTTYREETVYLMNDVNNIQVILQELEYPYQVNYADYDFKIIDDNFVLDSNNDVVEIATADYKPIYKPYAAENRITGSVSNLYGGNGIRLEEDNERPVQVACAEFSTSRLLVEHLATARLVITSRTEKDKYGNPNTIIDIPLIEYLMLIRGFGDSWIKNDQEFLDRQSRWNMMFFLQHGSWMNVCISVNAWIVRVNYVEF